MSKSQNQGFHAGCAYVQEGTPAPDLAFGETDMRDGN